MTEQVYLHVPAAWMHACGYGSSDRVFPVINIEKRGGFTVVVVDRDGRPWTIIKELRHAEYVHRP